MKSETDGVRAASIARLVTGLVLTVTVLLTFLSATWSTLPPVANATMPIDPAAGKPNAAARGENEMPAPVPGNLAVGGRVLNSKGQPVSGANVYLRDEPSEGSSWPPVAPPIRATTGSDGRFRFMIERSQIAADRSRGRFRGPLLAAFASGFGPGWTDELRIGEPDGALINLVEEGPPISGRLIDLEGRPVPDVNVRVIQVDATTENDLSAWIGEISKSTEASYYSVFQHFTRQSLPAGLSSLIPAKKTASDGRFQLGGAGRERIVSILLEGSRTETRILQVMTRVGRSRSVKVPGPRMIAGSPNEIVIHASNFDFVAAPTQPVEGHVYDATKGLPLSGVTIRPGPKHYFDGFTRFPLTVWLPAMAIRITTDAQGHYRLTGLSARPLIELCTEPTARAPYRPCTQEIATTPGVEPARLDFKLERGVLVRGKITDRTSKKPVMALAEYHPALDNPNLSSQSDLQLFEPVRTDADGSFSLVAFPGAGVVAATALGDRFLTADRAAAQESEVATAERNIPGFDLSQKCHAFRPIMLEKTADLYECNLALTPAPEPVVHILDADGKPLAGALIGGTFAADFAREGWWQAREQSVFRVTGLNGHRIRKLVIHHEGKQLAGSLAVRDSTPGPLVARLRPWGTVKGRLIDGAGQPRPGVALTYQESLPGISLKSPFFPRDVTTDASGNFTFEGLVRDQPYAIKLAANSPDGNQHRVGSSHVVDAGEVKELGDVREASP